ncbi:Ldh family oxidoreductase [Rhizobium sp. BK529]|uniref:Ldh family oxidoreductase n=1 Tax=Rhizobium sp. BK529 TaxID=2586983 RepID=UPI0039180C8E
MNCDDVARGKVMAAHQKDTDVPDNWALDGDGKPTTSPGNALNGSMMLLGKARDTALRLWRNPCGGHYRQQLLL